MILFETIRSYSGSKDNMSRHFPFLFILFFITWNCAGSSYQRLAIEDPAALVAMEDSLRNANRLLPSTVKALVTAHNSIGRSALDKNNYSSALQSFQDALVLFPSDTTAHYNLLIAEGNLLYKKGERNGLWDAIEKYHKAARLKPDSGEPFYHIGQAYLKNGNTDFDLILESYEKALSLDLALQLRPVVLAAMEREKKREKTLKDFWK
ncbi:MAG TPA: tetratricopeptide repeat protein [Candidatus Marinimicrobia bacterium]|nr:tetratricopeptide repeat protein [Candidatus Neomarinimicrobiota bacterium]